MSTSSKSSAKSTSFGSEVEIKIGRPPKKMHNHKLSNGSLRSHGASVVGSPIKMPALSENAEVEDMSTFSLDNPALNGEHTSTRFRAGEDSTLPSYRAKPRSSVDLISAPRSSHHYIDRVYDAVCRRVLKHLQTKLTSGRPALELFLLHRDRTVSQLHWFTLRYIHSDVLEREYPIFVAYEHILPQFFFWGGLFTCISFVLLAGAFVWDSYRKDATLEWGIIIVTILMLLFNGVLCFALSTVWRNRA